jgi:glycosyltransferase involved in cell wall biosynthesis
MALAVHDTVNDVSTRVAVVIPARNPGEALQVLLTELSNQALPAGTSLEVVVVDDGSQTHLDHLLLDFGTSLRLQVLRRDPGGHRGDARNAGSAKTASEYILFLDADCVPSDSHLIGAHLGALERGAVASCGLITGGRTGFWGQYQSRTIAKRIRSTDLHKAFFGTAANLMVRRDVFEAMGGFDRAYSAYGFEDRDLLVRLLASGDVLWTKSAIVDHRDCLHLAHIARKLCEAGRLSAPIFRERHPASYSQLGYATIDATLHPWLWPLGRTLGAWAATSAGRLEPVLHARWTPFLLRQALVKTVSALAFMHGTTLPVDSTHR